MDSQDDGAGAAVADTENTSQDKTPLGLWKHLSRMARKLRFTNIEVGANAQKVSKEEKKLAIAREQVAKLRAYDADGDVAKWRCAKGAHESSDGEKKLVEKEEEDALFSTAPSDGMWATRSADNSPMRPARVPKPLETADELVESILTLLSHRDEMHWDEMRGPLMANNSANPPRRSNSNCLNPHRHSNHDSCDSDQGGIAKSISLDSAASNLGGVSGHANNKQSIRHHAQHHSPPLSTISARDEGYEYATLYSTHANAQQHHLDGNYTLPSTSTPTTQPPAQPPASASMAPMHMLRRLMGAPFPSLFMRDSASDTAPLLKPPSQVETKMKAKAKSFAGHLSVLFSGFRKPSKKEGGDQYDDSLLGTSAAPSTSFADGVDGMLPQQKRKMGAHASSLTSGKGKKPNIQPYHFNAPLSKSDPAITVHDREGRTRTSVGRMKAALPGGAKAQAAAAAAARVHAAMVDSNGHTLPPKHEDRFQHPVWQPATNLSAAHAGAAIPGAANTPPHPRKAHAPRAGHGMSSKKLGLVQGGGVVRDKCGTPATGDAELDGELLRLALGDKPGGWQHCNSSDPNVATDRGSPATPSRSGGGAVAESPKNYAKRSPKARRPKKSSSAQGLMSPWQRDQEKRRLAALARSATARKTKYASPSYVALNSSASLSGFGSDADDATLADESCTPEVQEVVAKEGGRVLALAGSKAHRGSMGKYKMTTTVCSKKPVYWKVGTEFALYYFNKSWRVGAKIGSNKCIIMTTSPSSKPDKVKSIWYEARGPTNAMQGNPNIRLFDPVSGPEKKEQTPTTLGIGFKTGGQKKNTLSARKKHGSGTARKIEFA